MNFFEFYQSFDVGFHKMEEIFQMSRHLKFGDPCPMVLLVTNHAHI